MLHSVKTKALTAKHTAGEAVVAAGSAMKQGLGAAKDKGYEAYLKVPLVADTSAVGPSDAHVTPLQLAPPTNSSQQDLL
jgi:hypothetical protein